MKRFIEGVDRSQTTLFPERLEDWIDDDNPVRVIDVFVDALDLFDLGFERVSPCWTGRPGYHPSALLKLYVYGYLNRVQSSRRLEREAGRNVENGKITPETSRMKPDTSKSEISVKAVPSSRKPTIPNRFDTGWTHSGHFTMNFWIRIRTSSSERSTESYETVPFLACRC